MSKRHFTNKRKVLVIVGCIVLFYVGFYTGLTSYRDSILPQEVAQYNPPSRAELLKLINSERAKAGVAPLDKDVSLDVSAQMKADDMDANHYFGHIDKNGKQGYSYIVDIVGTKTCQYISENIDLANTPEGNSATAHVKSWMNSPDHRTALLDAKYTVTGFGIAGNNVVEHFCQPA